MTPPGSSAHHRSASAGLADGEHKVEIRAKDQAGNVDSTPSVRDWVIDRDPPTTTFTVQPDTVSNDANPTFEFTTNEAVSGSVCSPTAPCRGFQVRVRILGDLGVSSKP